MIFAKLPIIVGFSLLGCITSVPDEDTPPPQIDDIAEQRPEQKYGPLRVRMRCEYGCPATMPFVNIMPVFDHPQDCL